MKKRFSPALGFTLVELVVVIAVLSVLATIGFISLQGYAVDARDSSRLTVMWSMERGLSMRFVTTDSYPMPDSPVSVTASGYAIGYQGYAWGGVLSKIGMGNVKDPSDGQFFTYCVNSDASKFQLLGFLEGGKPVSSLVPVAHAAAPDYSKRFPHLLGNPLGIVLKADMSPIHLSATSVDLVTATGTYAIQYDDDLRAVGTWTVLRWWVGWGGLVGYWNFEETSGSVVRDVSGNGSDGVFSGSFVPTRNAGQVSSALDFASNSWVTSASGGYVDFGTLTGLKNTSAGTPHSIVGWVRASKPLCSDDNACRQWVLLLGSPGTGSHHWLIGGLHGPTQFGVWSWPQVKWFSYAPGAWQHIAMTFDGKKLVGYVNGVQAGTNSVSNVPFNMSDFRLKVGWGVQESPFDGKIDELRIYSRALSESEVTNLYRTSK